MPGATTVRLYGKDGEKGGQELLITAQVSHVGDISVSVPGATRNIDEMVKFLEGSGCHSSCMHTAF